jgi:hypothetical protein
MSTLPDLPDQLEDQPFDMYRTLGRIENAIVNMARDIHDAVAAQKSIIERVEKDEARLGKIENWQQNVDRRNEWVTRLVLVLLIPSLALAFNATAYTLKFIDEHETLLAPKPKP